VERVVVAIDEGDGLGRTRGSMARHRRRGCGRRQIAARRGESWRRGHEWSEAGRREDESSLARRRFGCRARTTRNDGRREGRVAFSFEGMAREDCKAGKRSAAVRCCAASRRSMASMESWRRQLRKLERWDCQNRFGGRAGRRLAYPAESCAAVPGGASRASAKNSSVEIPPREWVEMLPFLREN